jgi:hypothetical protein
MSNQNKTLAERLEDAKANSPLNNLTTQQAALKANNELKRGVSTGNVTKGVFKKGNEAWNKGIEGKETWGKTRSERAKTMSPEEHKAYFGTVENHTEETKLKMSESHKVLWAKRMKRVIAAGVEYKSIYEAAGALGVHKDTIVYRIKAKSPKWADWNYGE